jgi:hypothetical protein
MRYDEDGPSLGASIAALAADSGAPEKFVGKIRALFEAKGISLAWRAAPYLPALREAFRREQALRRTSEHGQAVVARAREDLSRIDQRWERQLSELRELKESLRHQARRLRDGVHRLHADEDSLAAPRRPVLCPGAVELPFVPGPDLVQ